MSLDGFFYWVAVITLVPGGAVAVAIIVAVAAFAQMDDMGHAVMRGFQLAACAALIWLIVWSVVLFA